MQKEKEKERIKIGITMGDFNGIGPEIIIKTLIEPRILRYFTPVIYGSPKVFLRYKKLFDLQTFSFHTAEDSSKIVNHQINIVHCCQEVLNVAPGTVSPQAGISALEALEASTKDLKAGIIDAVVTAPINKHNIQADNFRFAGHTEYYANAFESKDSLMLLVGEDLRVGVLTGHIPLQEVSKKITKELIANKLRAMLKSLTHDFGIKKPRIALLGLNPHAGENGLLGKEEAQTFIPVIEQFQKEGHLVFGPFPSDGFFGMMQHRQFDGVLASYHDQGLIPFKTLCFETGVNFTAGLSIVRTSPDHGTAYNIAGQNKANHQSFAEALFLAHSIVKNRKEEQQLAENALKPKVLK